MNGVFVMAGGADVRKDLDSVLAGYPNLKLLDQSGLKQDAKNQIATLANIILALLLLAVMFGAALRRSLGQ